MPASRPNVLGSDTPCWSISGRLVGPCKMIAPALEEISEELAGQVKIAKVDIMENTDIAAQMGVQSIPLMVLFKNGEAVARKVGAAPKSQLRRGSKASCKAQASTRATNSSQIRGAGCADKSRLVLFVQPVFAAVEARGSAARLVEP